jgi:flagellar protein FliS
MYSAQANPYQQYKQQSIMTMTPGEMLTQLFDGGVKNLTAAVAFIEEKDFPAANQALQKGQRIVNYLRQTLDHSYSVADGLDALYEYFGRVIVQANIRKDASELREIIPMLTELRDTFVAADRASRIRS